MEELLLGPLLAGKELDVVYEKDVVLPIRATEALDAALAAVADRVDEVVCELLGRYILHTQVREARVDVVSDRLQKVCLSEADTSIDEQRVVGATGRLGDSEGRCVREAIRRPHDERVEGVLRIEVPG